METSSKASQKSGMFGLIIPGVLPVFGIPGEGDLCSEALRVSYITDMDGDG